VSSLKIHFLISVTILFDYSSENFLFFNLKNVEIIFSVVYIPPESSIYSDLELFDNLEDKIQSLKPMFENSSFCISGDFNAKTKTLSDIIQFDRYNVGDILENVDVDFDPREKLFALNFYFYFEENILKEVDWFPYLGVRFSSNGKFDKARNHLIDQAR